MSNYPEGVTGREPQIAGPDGEREFTDERTCDYCETTQDVVVNQTIVGYTVYEGWICRAQLGEPDAPAICGYENTSDFPVEDLEDPDHFRD